jgi:hypothetical protein
MIEARTGNGRARDRRDVRLALLVGAHAHVERSALGLGHLSGPRIHGVKLSEREIRTLEGHTSVVTAVAFLPDGKQTTRCGMTVRFSD